MPKLQTTPLHDFKPKITCQICGPKQPQVLRQCYKHHLKTAHNNVTGNLRKWGQGSDFVVVVRFDQLLFQIALKILNFAVNCLLAFSRGPPTTLVTSLVKH